MFLKTLQQSLAIQAFTLFMKQYFKGGLFHLKNRWNNETTVLKVLSAITVGLYKVLSNEKFVAKVLLPFELVHILSLYSQELKCILYRF